MLVVIYDTDSRVLVLQRKDDPSFWQSVTGSLELNETKAQTASREVQEETGIDIAGEGYQLIDHQITNQYIIRPCWRHRYAPGIIHNTESVFSVQVTANAHPIILTEHLDFEWLSKSQAIRKVWSDTNRDAIDIIVKD